MTADLLLDAGRAALCIVEMQNDIVHESNIGNRGMGGVLAAQVQKRGVITKLQAVIAAARTAVVPILYVNFCGKPGFPRPNTLIHLYVKDIDAVSEEFGVPVDEEGLAGRECELEDLDGNRLRVATPR